MEGFDLKPPISVMSKLSPVLKTLIAAPHALGSPVPAPPRLTSLLASIRSRSRAHPDAFLTLSTAALVAVNSPDALCSLWRWESEQHRMCASRTAALMREVGLKCISFNGIPRTINALVALRASLPEDVVKQLTPESSRECDPLTIAQTVERGRSLWESIYSPFHEKLLSKLADAHPDMPVHILSSHYGPLLADPPRLLTQASPTPKNEEALNLTSGAVQAHATKAISSTGLVGRTLTSVVGISCLRAQTGVEPQLISHVHGLKKALGDDDQLEGREWLCSDAGVTWVLESVDQISAEVGQGRSFGRQVSRK